MILDEQIQQRMENKIMKFEQQSQLTNSSLARNKRIAFKMVPSTFEPPQQTQASSQYYTDRLTEYTRPHKLATSRDLLFQRYLQKQSANFNPNVEFVSSLINMKEAINFDEGDCIPFDSDDRWIIVSGQVKVIGYNLCSFLKKQGFLFFASPETKRKVKQIVSMSSTSAFRIPYQIFKQNIRNYLYIKNAQKIKFLKYCPFLNWSQSLSEDLAITMDMIETNGKDQIIYKQGDQADYIYFVKQGVILLERTGKAGNQIILNFEKHYQASYISQQEGLIIVRKGMLFGADGILIKQINQQIDLLNGINPEDIDLSNTAPQTIISEPQRLKNTRIYNAKAIGKCQLYKLDKNVLETYLKNSNQTGLKDHETQLSNKQLDRICLQYTNLLMGSNSINKEIKKKNFQFNLKVNEGESLQMLAKKRKVQQIKGHQKKIKKVANSTPEIKKMKKSNQIQQLPILNKSPPKNKNKKALSCRKDVSLPSLNKNHIQNLIMKKLQIKEAQEYMGYKKRIQNAIFAKQHKNEQQHTHQQTKKNEVSKQQNLNCFNVRSYRSLLSSMN